MPGGLESGSLESGGLLWGFRAWGTTGLEPPISDLVMHMPGGLQSESEETLPCDARERGGQRAPILGV